MWSLLRIVEEAASDVSTLLALVGALDVARAHCLRVIAQVVQPEKPSQPSFISVSAACRKYPVSRSFLYERGEAEGIVTRPSRRKVVVNVEALERWLGGRR